jgi:hypothetical protein
MINRALIPIAGKNVNRIVALAIAIAATPSIKCGSAWLLGMTFILRTRLVIGL